MAQAKASLRKRGATKAEPEQDVSEGGTPRKAGKRAKGTRKGGPAKKGVEVDIPHIEGEARCESYWAELPSLHPLSATCTQPRLSGMQGQQACKGHAQGRPRQEGCGGGRSPHRGRGQACSDEYADCGAGCGSADGSELCTAALLWQLCKGCKHTPAGAAL